MDDVLERIDRQMCNRRSEDQCGCPLCVILAEAAAEIRSLRAQVAHERAGIVAWLREPVIGGDHYEPVNDIHAQIADAIERHEDKEPRA